MTRDTNARAFETYRLVALGTDERHREIGLLSSQGQRTLKMRQLETLISSMMMMIFDDDDDDDDELLGLGS